MKKRYTHQLLTLLLSAAVCVNMSGCQGKTETAETAPPAAVSTETTTAVTDKDGNKVATAADFSKVTICGTEFNMPCKASDFTGDFSVESEAGAGNTFLIYYKDTPIGLLGYDENIKVNLKKDKPNSILLFEGSNYSVAGFSDNMNSTQLIKFFGEPNRTSKNDDSIITMAMYSYNNIDSNIDSVIFSTDNKITDDSTYDMYILFTY